MKDLNNDVVRRIIIIDDNNEIHNDFRSILSENVNSEAMDELEADIFGHENSKKMLQHRYELEYASQGQEGFEKIKQALSDNNPFMLVFVDMRMPPGWDGLETIKNIWEVDPAIHIVICSAYSDYSWEEIVEKLGNKDNLLILKKPFDVAEVCQLASALTEKWSLARQTEHKQKDLEDAVARRTSELSKTNEQLEQEIEERKIAEEELARVAAQWRTTFDSISDFVTIHDTDFQIVRANRALADFLKVEPKDLIGKKCYQLFHGLSEPCPNCPHRRTMETEKPCTDDFFEPHLGIHIEVFTSPIFDSKGELIGSAHITRDITERKQADEELQKTLAEIERSNRLMTGRELRMIELKKEVNALLRQLGREEEYQKLPVITEPCPDRDQSG